MKVGDKVIVTGAKCTGQKGTIRRRCKIAIPGESQVEAWEVKLPCGPYKFHKKELKPITNCGTGE
jgi:hypothetical protein